MLDHKKGDRSLQINKKAYFNYEMVETIECGIALEGTEVKSIREGRFSFSDSYIKIEDGLKLIGFTIQPYAHGSIHNHETTRTRSLLAHKQEIKRLRRKVEEKGLTLIPIRAYIKNNLVKIEIALARGKAAYDKKQTLKERDLDRQMRRDTREMGY